MELRSYQPGDLAAMHALDIVCFPPPFRFSRGAMRRFAEAENALVRLAFHPVDEAALQGLVAFGIVHVEQVRGELFGYVVTLDVAPAAHGKGIAGALMGSLEYAAAQAGAQTMSLHVFKANGAAIRLYERLGYAFVRTERSFYGPGLHARIYSKPLRSPMGSPVADPAVHKNG